MIGVFQRLTPISRIGDSFAPGSRCHHILYKKWWNSFWTMINPYLKNGTRYHQPIKKTDAKIGPESSISRRCLGRLLQSSDYTRAERAPKPSAFMGTSQASWWLWCGWLSQYHGCWRFLFGNSEWVAKLEFFCITSPLWITFHIKIHLKTH